MRTHTIALITGSSRAADSEFLNELFRHWPEGVATPRLEPITPEALLEDESSVRNWDAAVLVLGEHQGDSSWVRIADVMQQSLVPLLLLSPGPTDRLQSFHPGSVVALCARTDPRVTGSALYALAARQSAVRSIDQNLRLAQSFHGETAAEIDRLHTELLLAARVQRDFLPKQMPEVPGLGAQVLFRPHGFVSGDTYDVRRVDEDHVSFFLADAMGHGVPAALMTLYISGSLPRSEVGPEGFRIVMPGEALSKLNNELHESLAGPARFATAVCGMIDLRTRAITLACAGHPAPLRVSRHGVKPVEVSGMLMGVVADYVYEQVTIRLEDDELLVLHSDGLEAAFNPRNTAPTDTTSPIPPYFPQIAGMRRAHALTSLDNAMEYLAGTLDTQAGSFHQDDDLTVLAFQLDPASPAGKSDRASAGLGRGALP